MPRPGTPRAHHRHPKTGKLTPASRRSQRPKMPTMDGRTKLFGLKKLKLIVQGIPGVRVAPFKVLGKPADFQQKHASGSPRLLVRTDERGKQYRSFQYAAMPRRDVPTDFSEKTIRTHLEEMEILANLGKPRKSRFWYIIHPTRNRWAVELTGNIRFFIERGTPCAGVKFTSETNEKSHFFNEDAGEWCKYEWISGRLTPTKFSSQFQSELLSPRVKAMMDKIELLIQRAYITKQVADHGNRTTVIKFNTWNHAPKEIELYDLREVRQPPARKKK